MKIQDIEEISEPESVAALTAGAMLLTSTSLLAFDWKRRLVSAFGRQVCETPAVYSWQAWLSALSAGQPMIPVALNHIQETRLWEQVIQDDLPEQPAMSVHGLAVHARDAYALMREYQIDVAELACSGEEAAALARWIGAIRKKFNKKELTARMLEADLGHYLLPRMKEIVTAEAIILTGFESFTPIQQHLFEAVQASGARLMRVKSSATPARPVLYACADAQSEYVHIAARIKMVLEVDPLACIAVVTSDAISDLSALRRVLAEGLMPEARLDFSFSRQAVLMAGDRLTDSPMIRQLLQFLAMAGEAAISFDEASLLLFSPWLQGYETERMGRARLDQSFRQQNRHRMTFKGLLHSSRVQELPELLSVIRALAAWNRHGRSANEWIRAVHELLKTAGIVQSGQTHGAARSNHEIRQMNAFRDVLVSLVAIDAVDHKLAWTQFLSLLRMACSEVRLALTAKYANVVVMPLARIAGLSFDHVFVMGLDEEVFPPPARPRPLLPANVQKRYAIPMSSGALAYEASQQLWTRLLQSAPSVEISYAKQRDERELLPSSFVARVEPQGCCVSDTEIIQLPLEDFDDAPNVPLGLNEAVRGGAAIIKNQSACPFRAFATHRLGISRLEETSPGIEPKRKGALVHLALEYIWKRLKTQKDLAALKHDKLLELIDASIDYSWCNLNIIAGTKSQKYEQKRMRGLLIEWLKLELKRPNFRVLGIEKEYLMQLPEGSRQQFSVRIKADRLDEDESGRRILIDYKTGEKQLVPSWLKERIEEPQLPQYALVAGLDADDAVAFARVRSGDMAYEGLCGEDIGISGIVACDGKRGAPQDWRQVLNAWRVNINALAAEFVDGRCDVSPRNTNVCRHCGLEAICRIGEIGFDTDTDGSQEGRV